MNITCPNCQAKLNLPDDKIPKHRDSTFKCPKCKEPVQIKAGRTGAQTQPPPGAAAGSHKAQVLVCMADAAARTKVLNAVARSGWAADSVASPKKALQQLEYEIYPLLIMDEAFDGSGEMAAHLNELDMSLRRRICLVLFSPTAQTGDAMTALHTSCNFVVNSEDAAKKDEAFLCDVLASARTEHENFYRVYNDSMRAAGKA